MTWGELKGFLNGANLDENASVAVYDYNTGDESPCDVLELDNEDGSKSVVIVINMK